MDTNWRVISQHANTEHHKATIQFLKERPNQKFHVTLLRIKKFTLVEKEKEIYLATANMFRVVYVEVMLNYPFFSHDKLVQLIQSTGGKFW